MIFRSMSLAALLLLAFSGAAQAVTTQLVGDCTVRCDQKLAACERGKGGAKGCPRQHQSCVEHCTAPPKLERRSRNERRRELCAQRCDLNMASCSESNPGHSEQCRAGQQTCTSRCK
ncbi:MAG: hypothetical protein V4709_07410 [Pseudomonadota bacterium]